MAGQKKYGATEDERFILDRIRFYRDEKIPPLPFQKIADALNRDCKTKRGNRWSALNVFYRYRGMKENA